MTLVDIPSGASVFVDANILIYYLTPDPVFGLPCKQFFERIERQEIQAFTSTHELSDVAHRLMTYEAMAQFGWPIAGIAQRLRRFRNEIAKLTQFQSAVEDVRKSKMNFLPVTASLVVKATAISRQHALLSGDALILALMQANGLTNFASNDADFDVIPGITRYAPL